MKMNNLSIGLVRQARLVGNLCTNILSPYSTLDIPILTIIENQDWQVMLHAMCDSRWIHNPKVFIADLFEREGRVKLGFGIFFWIGTVDPVYTGCLHENIGF